MVTIDSVQRIDGWWVVRAFGLAALFSSLLGRALSPALRGSASGIADYIRASMWLSSLLAQLCAVGGIAVVSLLLLRTIRNARLRLTSKVILIPSATLVLLGVMVSMRVREVDPDGVLAVALAAGAAALSAGGYLAPSTSARAVGITLLGCGGSAILHAFARIMALRASLAGEASEYLIARIVVTLGFAAELSVLALVVVWLAKSTPSRGVLKASSIVGLAALSSVVSLLATAEDTSALLVFASRSVAELLRQPAPFIPDLLRGSVELSAMGVGLWALAGSRSKVVPATMGLCLVARGATDIPLLALALTVAALTPLACGSAPARVETEPSPERAKPGA